MTLKVKQSTGRAPLQSKIEGLLLKGNTPSDFQGRRPHDYAAVNLHGLGSFTRLVSKDNTVRAGLCTGRHDMKRDPEPSHARLKRRRKGEEVELNGVCADAWPLKAMTNCALCNTF